MGPLNSVLAALASAIALALAFRGGAWSALAWVALVPLLVAVRSRSRSRWGAVGLAIGWSLVFGCGIAEPFPRSISNYFEQPGWLGWAFALGLIGTMGSPYFVAFVLVDRGLASFRGSLVGPLLVACAWVALEWVRGRLFTETLVFIGNPWGLLGYSQLAALPVVQIAEFTGVYGPSFLVALFNATLADLVVREAGRARPSLQRVSAGIGLALAPVIAAGVYGLAVLPEPGHREAGSIRVAAVQANVSLASRWKSEFYGTNLDQYLKLTQGLATPADGGSPPRVVFWPEGSFTFFLETEPDYRRLIGRRLSALDVQLIAGGPALVPTADGEGETFRNRVFTIEPDGEIAGRYDKEHLVPFSEYVPGQAPDPMRRDFGAARSFAHGTRSAPIPSRAGAVGVLICNEALLAEVAAERVRGGAEILANPSNDSWVSERDFARRMLEHVAFRSIELRRSMIRASTEGPSAIVDPWGRVTAMTSHGEAATLVGEVAPRRDLTVYARFGDWFPALCAVWVLTVGIARWRARAAAARPPVQ